MIADTVYATYAQKPGSEHIASLDACRGLEQIVRRFRPRRVLEIGSGIGTLTDLLAQTLDPGAELVSLEDNAYCLEQRRLNLGPRLGRAVLLPDLGALDGGSFDLVVVDGGRADASVMPFLAKHGVVFVEGFRGAQRQLLYANGRSCARMNIRSMRRGGSPHGGDAWGGAYWVYRFEPTLSERAQFVLRHFWDSLLVKKRRKLTEMLRR